MQHPAGTDPERELERGGDELEERIEKLDDQIGEARTRAEEQDPFEDEAGDWEDTDDDSGGEDAEGFDDPELDDDEDDDDEPMTTRRGWSGSRRTRPAAMSATARGRSSCSIGCRRAWTSAASRASGASSAR